MPRWNVNGDFTLPAHDTGNIRDTSYMRAPWGPGSWGIGGRTFTSSVTSIAGQRYYVNGGQAYLYGKEARGDLGFVRYIQGAVWGGSYPWHIPPPLPLQVGAPASRAGPLAIRSLWIDLDLYRDTSRSLGSGRSWVMYAINVWVSSPHFPSGSDINHKKALVLDLAFYHSGGSLSSHASDKAHHYQAEIGVTPERSWQSWSVNLGYHIDTALRFFGLPSREAKLYQAEFLIELRNAEGAAMIDNFHLNY